MPRINSLKTLSLGLIIIALMAYTTPGYAQILTKKRLPKFLKDAAKLIKPGTRINSSLVIVSVKVRGVVMTTNYLMDAPGRKFEPAEFKNEQTKADIINQEKAMCTSGSLDKTLKMGAKFKRVYRNRDRKILYQFQIDQKICEQYIQ